MSKGRSVSQDAIHSVPTWVVNLVLTGRAPGVLKHSSSSSVQAMWSNLIFIGQTSSRSSLRDTQLLANTFWTQCRSTTPIASLLMARLRLATMGRHALFSADVPTSVPSSCQVQPIRCNARRVVPCMRRRNYHLRLTVHRHASKHSWSPKMTGLLCSNWLLDPVQASWRRSLKEVAATNWLYMEVANTERPTCTVTRWACSLR